MNQHVTTVQRIYEAFGKGDIPTVISYLADDVAWDPWTDNSAQKSGVPWLQARNGKAGVAEYFKLVSEFNIKDFQVLSVMGNENQVAVEMIFEVDVPSTGGHFRDEEIHLWTFNEEGKVSRMRHYTDTAQHIAAAKQNQ